jgi:hypothetical protein
MGIAGGIMAAQKFRRVSHAQIHKAPEKSAIDAANL